MAINNTYVLEVDLKRQMTGRTPSFRKGDNGILIFKIFDDGIEYDIGSVNKAEIYHKTSNGNVIKSNCDFINFEGQRAIRYVYEEKAMIDVGRNETLLVVYENNVAISIQPFPVIIYSDLKGGANSLLELIQSLQSQINSLILDLNNTIKQSEKGKPNGVATLDASGKIPLEQLPPQLEAFKKHIPETVWKNQVHGMRIDKDGILQYDTGNNTWQNVGFAPSAVGGGTPAPQLLDATITKSNSVATVKYTGVPTVAVQKWAVGDRDKSYFVSNGTTFTGLTFPIAQLGIHTLYYKDSNGMEYVKTFNVAVSDLSAPTITVDVENGTVTVNISQSTSIKKWAKGQQNIGYFQSQGNVFTGNSFNITEVGWYTIYYKTTTGAEYIYQFEVNFAQLNGGLPIVTYADVFNNDTSKNLRAFQIGINDSRVTRVKYTGRDASVGGSDYDSVYEDNGYYYTNGITGYVNANSTNHDMTVEFMDNNGSVYGTAVHKCRANYNYFVVNNQYVSLTRIKNSTTNYTLPSTIEGLPVLDAGCIFFTNNPAVDNWNTKNLTVHSSILSGGRFATYTKNSTIAIETIRIENNNFKINIPSSFRAFSNNKNGGIVIYVPNNSETYNTINNKTLSSYAQIQTF